jgi:hypothetical protein
MEFKLLNTISKTQLERELRRERLQRVLNDNAKIGQSNLEEGRSKDARETVDSVNLRRHHNF